MLKEVPVGSDGERSRGDDTEPVDDRDAKLQESIDREYGVEDTNDEYSQSELPLEPMSDKFETEKTIENEQTFENEEEDLDSISSRLSTKMSNYTIAFSTEQEVVEKGDNSGDTSHGKSSSEVEVKGSASPEKISSVQENVESGIPDKSSSVPEVKESVNSAESSSVSEDKNSTPEKNSSDEKVT